MDKLNGMDTQSLMMLASYLMLFPNNKTIKQCHSDINNVITARVKKKEDLMKCKIIKMSDYKNWRDNEKK